MNRILLLVLFVWFIVVFSGCSHKSIQQAYWDAGTFVAHEEEKKGNIGEAEKELRIAVGRAKKELDDEKIASSLHNLGAFYRRQNRLSDAIHYLGEALKLEERVSGPTSVRTGRTLAELSASYLMEGNLFEGRPYAKRLEPLAKYYSGNEAMFVQKVLESYEIDTEKYNKIVAELKPLAKSGDPKAQYELAGIYFDGPDAKKIFPEIFALYEASANQGFAESQYYLGVLYDKGRGVAKDDSTARKWYRKAAESGHKIGQWNYAVFLIQGRGGPEKENEAWDWIKKSAAQGYPSAKRALMNH
ncbi:MAG: tetratricopeptide repeat protein [Desulfobacteraceae bacterium]|nr:tetratricopeptide repeat protein [Desulfobacteraceae bacterium]